VRKAGVRLELEERKKLRDREPDDTKKVENKGATVLMTVIAI
jgi:hypothetical protein